MIRFDTWKGTTTILSHEATVSYADGRMTVSFDSDFDTGDDAVRFAVRLGAATDAKMVEVHIDGTALREAMQVREVMQSSADKGAATRLAGFDPRACEVQAVPNEEALEAPTELASSPAPPPPTEVTDTPKSPAKRGRGRKPKEAEVEQAPASPTTPAPVPTQAPARVPPVDLSSPAWSQTSEELARVVEHGQQAGVLAPSPERGLFAPLPTSGVPVQQAMFAPVRPGMAWSGTTVSAVQPRADGNFDVVLADGTLLVVDAQANVVSSSKPVAPAQSRPAPEPEGVVEFDPDRLTTSLVEYGLTTGKPIEVIRHLHTQGFPAAMIVAWAETKPAGVTAFELVPDPRSRAKSCLISLGVKPHELEG